ncbi:hypothetical protein D9M68_661650 [compost metagenome]
MVAGEEAHIEAEQRLGRFEQQGGESATRQRMAQRHPGIGHRCVDQGEGGDAGRQRHEPQQGLGAIERVRAGNQRQRGDVGAHRETGPQQQWAEAEDRPVEQEAGHAAARLAHAPDGVEGLLDGHQHHEGGHHQQADTDPGQVPGLHGEAAQVLLQGLSRGRHEVAEDEALDLLARTLEGRDHREHGEGHRHHRHHREQAGVRQGRGAFGATIGHEPLQQEAPEFHDVGEALAHSISLIQIGPGWLSRPLPRRTVQDGTTTRLE